MKEKLRKILQSAAKKWEPLPNFDLERPKVKTHGELSANLAMILARREKANPQLIAQEIISEIQKEKDSKSFIETMSIAGGGFLNFVLKKNLWQKSLQKVFSDSFGSSNLGQGKKVVVEFVSANPTGPLHIGNARGGPLGDAIAALLQAVGYEVTREYYVNDVGGQIDKLGESILYWICEGNNPDAKGPEGYQGDYVKELAQEATKNKIKNEAHALGRFGIHRLMEQIRQDCKDMRIHFDVWIHEKEILGSGKTEAVLKEMEKRGVTKKEEGALWFADPQNQFLQDRECVLERSDGRPTYFANDIAYHLEKYKKGYDRLINIWGSNHHGHVPRVKAAVQCLGEDPEKIETVLYQYVRVKRGKDAVKMSKRGGNFVTAREVLDEVGADALRFFLLMRAPDSHLDFDLELAKTHSQENPVYYVQYAHARLASIERKAAEQGIVLKNGSVKLDLLNLPEELEMIRLLLEYPDEILRAAQKLEPHRIAFYLLELTKLFQSYYTKAKEDDRYRVISSDVDTTLVKLYLCRALKLTLEKGLKILGVSAPELMTQE